jgi:hypothetical protein
MDVALTRLSLASTAELVATLPTLEYLWFNGDDQEKRFLDIKKSNRNGKVPKTLQLSSNSNIKRDLFRDIFLLQS